MLIFKVALAAVDVLIEEVCFDDKGVFSPVVINF